MGKVKAPPGPSSCGPCGSCGPGRRGAAFIQACGRVSTPLACSACSSSSGSCSSCCSTSRVPSPSVGGGIANGQALAVQAVRWRKHPGLARHGVGHLLEDSGLLCAFAGQCVVQAGHAAAGDAAGGHAFQQHLALEPGNDGRHDGQQFQAVLGTLHIGGKARVLDNVGAHHHLAAELVELAVVAHCNDQRAIRGLEHAIGHDGRMGIAIALGVVAQQHGIQGVVAVDTQAAVVQRQFHLAATACPLTAEQGRQHRLRGVHASHQIDHGHPELQRRRARFAIDGHQAGFGLDHQVVARALGFGRAAVVAGHAAVDQIGLDGLELFVTDAQLFGTTMLEVVDHHVKLRQQVVDQLHPFRGLQIQGDGPLVAVHAVVVGGLGLADAHAPVARIVTAAGVFHLDHFRTKVGQHLSAQRPGKHTRKVQHAHAFQREIHLLVLGLRHLFCHCSVSLDLRALSAAGGAASQNRGCAFPGKRQCLRGTRRSPGRAPCTGLPAPVAAPACSGGPGGTGP